MATSLSKALIVVKDTGAKLQCRFNPSEYTVSKSAAWTRTLVRGAETAATPEFVGTNPRALQMDLFFDGWDSGTGDISGEVQQLLDCTNPTARSISDNRPSPPVVFFQWGQKPLFDAYVKSVSVRFTLFEGDGTPVRATASVTFEEIPDQPPPQNPTSGGRRGKRSHLVMAGESLHWIAFVEYGRADLWRGIAVHNRIHDPFRLSPGAHLDLPPIGEAERLG
jgi:hypothetical protein